MVCGVSEKKEAEEGGRETRAGGGEKFSRRIRAAQLHVHTVLYKWVFPPSTKLLDLTFDQNSGNEYPGIITISLDILAQISKIFLAISLA